jgi:hypothetical protein
MNTSPQISLSIRLLRYRLALTQSSTDVDMIAKSTYQALRAYYAATKSDSDAYVICKESVSGILEKLVICKEGASIVNFLASIAKKAGLLSDVMKWDDLGLRKCVEANRSAKALFLLRNAGIIFSDEKELIGMNVFKAC